MVSPAWSGGRRRIASPDQHSISLLAGAVFVNWWGWAGGVCLALLFSLSVEAEGPFRVGLWAAESAAQRVEAVREGLERAVGPELRRAGYEGIEVECSADYERRFADLRQGRFDLLEAEPGTYFLARRRWLAYDPERWRYELIFQ
ncbi:MAG TPA: hypothetical protein ENN74_03365, partial [Firmicutes bacterium]|nr:hypothetical protein [Bacillota bacterium]